MTVSRVLRNKGDVECPNPVEDPEDGKAKNGKGKGKGKGN
jgi:hypothetical protein